MLKRLSQQPRDPALKSSRRLASTSLA